MAVKVARYKPRGSKVSAQLTRKQGIFPLEEPEIAVGLAQKAMTSWPVEIRIGNGLRGDDARSRCVLFRMRMVSAEALLDILNELLNKRRFLRRLNIRKFLSVMADGDGDVQEDRAHDPLFITHLTASDIRTGACVVEFVGRYQPSGEFRTVLVALDETTARSFRLKLRGVLGVD